ncbi:MAG TPA: amino acid ABC transporter substrate-binding protein [Coxiellaceae bacterium]|nr:amino acid ABC transporter substrate-binding protein [Coxiellaceae bacterium]
MNTKLLATLFLLLCYFTTVFANSDDSYKKIQTKGTFIVGLDETFAPMGFRDKNGQIIGFDIDLAKEVARRLKVKIVFQPCVWDSIFFELKNSNIDAIWNGMTISEERKIKVLFSKPYMTNKVVVLVNKNSDIKRLADLNGKKVAAQSGAPAVDYIQNYKGSDFKPTTLKKLVQYPDNPMALYDLIKGGVDAVAVDEIFADYYTKMQKLKFRKLSGFLGKQQFGIAFRKNEVALRDKVQSALDSMIQDGTAAKISKKWFDRNIFSVKEF